MRGRIDSDCRYDVFAEIVGVDIGKDASAKPKQFIHKDLPLSVRTLRDLYKEGIDRVRVDSKETYHRLLEFAEVFVPEIVPVIEHYTGECPVFDIFSVEDEIKSPGAEG